MNKVILLGNLGNAPEFKRLASGQTLLKFSIATHAVWRDKQNPSKQNERTDWHRIVVWGPRAERLHSLLRRGQRVMIEGSIRHNTVHDESGQKRTYTDIVADNIQFADSPASQAAVPEARAS